jgi:hypothetical protein
VNNQDVYEKDINTFSLENQGVAKVDEALGAQQQQTLRFELETFVCKGHYEEGIKRILETYIETTTAAESRIPINPSATAPRSSSEEDQRDQRLDWRRNRGTTMA